MRLSLQLLPKGVQYVAVRPPPGLPLCGLNPPPPVADRVARACWITFRLCRLLFFEDFVFHSVRAIRKSAPCTDKFTVSRTLQTPPRNLPDTIQTLKDLVQVS